MRMYKSECGCCYCCCWHFYFSSVVLFFFIIAFSHFEYLLKYGLSNIIQPHSDTRTHTQARESSAASHNWTLYARCTSNGTYTYSLGCVCGVCVYLASISIIFSPLFPLLDVTHTRAHTLHHRLSLSHRNCGVCSLSRALTPNITACRVVDVWRWMRERWCACVWHTLARAHTHMRIRMHSGPQWEANTAVYAHFWLRAGMCEWVSVGEWMWCGVERVFLRFAIVHTCTVEDYCRWSFILARATLAVILLKILKSFTCSHSCCLKTGYLICKSKMRRKKKRKILCPRAVIQFISFIISELFFFVHSFVRLNVEMLFSHSFLSLKS